MPAKNSRKQYYENGYYHIYNRGVEKRKIFLDEQDHGVFLSYLKEYLTSKNERELQEKLADATTPWGEKDKILKRLRLNNFCDEISLLAYCLMPNHFHFFIKQKSAGSIDKFMNSLCTRYTMYSNKKYKRVGHLYQGVYKAISISSEAQLLHLSRYIHKQSLSPRTLQGQALQKLRAQMVDYPSSYQEYLGKRKTGWVHPEEILSYFSKENSDLAYESFVKQDSDDSQILKDIILSEEE
jgi:putative transposase